MKIDKSICRARQAAHLPCRKCEKYPECPGNYQENTEKVQISPKNTTKKTESAIKSEVKIPDKIKRYQKKERKNFSPDDIKILKDTSIPARIAAKMTGHHVNSIYRWRKRNNVILPFVPYGERFRSNAWTEIELEIVKDASLSTRQVQERINRSADAIRQRRMMLGIRTGERN